MDSQVVNTNARDVNIQAGDMVLGDGFGGRVIMVVETQDKITGIIKHEYTVELPCGIIVRAEKVINRKNKP